jgi:hypothetical protein
MFAGATSLAHLRDIILSEPAISSTAFTEVVRLLNTTRHSDDFVVEAQERDLFVSDLKKQFNNLRSKSRCDACEATIALNVLSGCGSQRGLSSQNLDC